MSNDTLSGGCVAVGVNKSACGGVVVTALQIVQACFGVVDVTTVAQGVMGAQGGSKAAGGGQDVASGIIGVGMALAPGRNPRIPAGGMLLFSGDDAV